MSKTNILADKSFTFAIRVMKLHSYLVKNKLDFAIAGQVLRSATAVGALVTESEYASTKKDFANKLSISLKEANETRYWLRLLHKTEYISKKIYESMLADCEDLIKILTSSIKTINNRGGFIK